MFATLAGGYPSPPPGARPSPDRAEDVRLILAAQEAAGLELLTDGGLGRAELEAGLLTSKASRPVPTVVDAWRLAARSTDRPVKQAIPGPYTLGRLIEPTAAGRRTRATLAIAEALNEELAALSRAGCPLVQVDEDAATTIGDDEGERALFRDAQRRLTAGHDGSKGPHLCLAITGGSADAAGAATILGGPYRSFLFDLVAGPDNWRLIVDLPGDRGVVCGVVDGRPDRADDVEVLLWAARYAASTASRGLDRVGLSTSGSLAALSWEAAGARIDLLGRAARSAGSGSAAALAARIDPRAVDRRSVRYRRNVPTRQPR